MQIRKKLLIGVVAAATLAGGANVVALAVSPKSPAQSSREAEVRGREVEPGDDRGRGIEPGDDRGREVEARGRVAEGEIEFELDLDHRRGRDDDREDSSGPSDNSGPGSDNSGPGHDHDDDGGHGGHGGHGDDE